VIDAARVAGHIDEHRSNPARWAGHLKMLLPPPARLPRGYHAAMAYAAEVPAFMKRLSGQNSIAALALRFLILTAARTGEVLGARWAEIDLDAKVWTVTASRMKAGRRPDGRRVRSSRVRLVAHPIRPGHPQRRVRELAEGGHVLIHACRDRNRPALLSAYPGDPRSALLTSRRFGPRSRPSRKPC
jgi:integrase